MGKRITAFVAVLALIGAGCGGDDDEESTSPDANSGGEPYDITASEFVAALEPEKRQILEDFAADNPDCQGAVDDGFVTYVSVRATELPPDDPIGPEILDACTPE
jgi:hypothetical protein